MLNLQVTAETGLGHQLVLIALLYPGFHTRHDAIVCDIRVGFEDRGSNMCNGTFEICANGQGRFDQESLLGIQMTYVVHGGQMLAQLRNPSWHPRDHLWHFARWRRHELQSSAPPHDTYTGARAAHAGEDSRVQN